MIFPDRYKRLDSGLPFAPGGAPLASVIGFDGKRILSSPRLPDDEAMMRTARLDFERQIVMRLPRELAGVVLSSRATAPADDRFAIDASGPDGFKATLFAAARTCVPIALEYTSGAVTTRVELSDYRTFGGLRFPTMLKTFENGQPFAEEQVSDIQVNAPGANEYFSSGR